MGMIALINYNMGNLHSVKKALERAGAEVVVTSSSSDLKKAEKIVLPGVGAFASAMAHLKRLNLLDALREWIESGKPFLGICLGLQILFESSEEGGRHKGLGILKGKVRRFQAMPTRARPAPFRRGHPGVPACDLKIPHIGWNEVHFKPKKRCPILKDIPEKAYFYFVHSYYVEPKDKDIVIGTTDYGVEFASAISYNNLFASQFHIEKSGDLGLKVIENFVKCTR